jgi:Ca-activated chloride channel family protein
MFNFSNIEFAYPFVLYGLAIIPFLVFWYWKRNKKFTPDITYSSLKIFGTLKPTMKERLRHVPFILRMLAIAVLIVALARPQTYSTGENVYTEGIDIAMVLDISGSMLAEDFQPNRLEAAKDVINDFVQGRTSDKIGLVVFARESFPQSFKRYKKRYDYRWYRNRQCNCKWGKQIKRQRCKKQSNDFNYRWRKQCR